MVLSQIFYFLITGDLLVDLFISICLMIAGILTIIGLTVKVICYKYNIRRREGKGIIGKLFGQIYRLKEDDLK